MNTKLCRFCGEEFTPKSNRQVYCSKPHHRKCSCCGQLYLERYSENLSKPPRTCSPNCRKKHQKYEIPEFQILETIDNTVFIDSTQQRQKYDNLHVSQYLFPQHLNPIHIFPGEVIDTIINKYNITQQYDASEFKVYKLNLDYAQEFLQDNDIVPYYKSTTLALGLVKNYEIFQILTFASPRYSKQHDYELVRCCSKLNTKIVGGLDLLSSTASLDFGITSCIAYQDLSKNFDSTLLESIGMRVDHVNPPRLLRSNVFDCGVKVLVF